MKILLVQPMILGKASAPPLGLAYLASVARSLGHEVALIDNEHCKLAERELLDRIRKFSPDVLGITSTITSRASALKVAALGEEAPYIVFGGPQPTLSPEYYLTKSHHFVIRGEGEVAFANFLHMVENSLSPETVPGLCYRKGDGVVACNSPQPYIKDISEIPYPAHDLLPMTEYAHHLEGEKCATMIATRGCPFRCVNCYHVLNTRFRWRSPENVIGEMRSLMNRYGFTRFKFFDDNFTLHKKHTARLCEKIIEDKLDVLWQNLSRVDCLSDDLLNLMYAAGCRQTSLGIESGSQKTLDRMRKKTSVEQNRWAIEACRNAGIKSKAYIMIGFPWETKADIEETIRFVESTVPDYIQVLLVTPMPGTDLEAMLKAEGVAVDKDALSSIENSPDFIVPTFETEHWTRDELKDLYRELHERYYAAGGRGGKNKLRTKNASSQSGRVKRALHDAFRSFVGGKR